jgi:hypothetical protein
VTEIFKNNKNNFFTPSVLVFLSLCIYFFSTQSFAESNYQYAYILGITGIVLAVKIFFLAFLKIEKYTKQQKWISLVIELSLAGLGWGLTFLGINHLSQDKFPEFTIFALFLANLTFLLQLFLGHILKAKTATISILIYSIFIIILNRKWFINQDQILTQQFIAYSLLILEFVLLMSVARITVKALKSQK